MSGAPPSALVVDDDDLDRYLLSRDLRRCGVALRLRSCSDGEEALALLSDPAAHQDDLPPRLIFLDVNMPRMSGPEFLDAFAALRAERPGLSRCAVVMLSSSELPEDQALAARHPFVEAFVTKGSIRPAELRALLERALDQG